VCVCAWVRERERERERKKKREKKCGGRLTKTAASRQATLLLCTESSWTADRPTSRKTWGFLAYANIGGQQHFSSCVSNWNVHVSDVISFVSYPVKISSQRKPLEQSTMGVSAVTLPWSSALQGFSVSYRLSCVGPR